MSVAFMPEGFDAENARIIQTIQKIVFDEEKVPSIQDRFELDQLLDQLKHSLEPQTDNKKEDEPQAAKDAEAQHTPSDPAGWLGLHHPGPAAVCQGISSWKPSRPPGPQR